MDVFEINLFDCQLLLVVNSYNVYTYYVCIFLGFFQLSVHIYHKIISTNDLHYFDFSTTFVF